MDVSTISPILQVLITPALLIALAFFGWIKLGATKTDLQAMETRINARLDRMEEHFNERLDRLDHYIRVQGERLAKLEAHPSNQRI